MAQGPAVKARYVALLFAGVALLSATSDLVTNRAGLANFGGRLAHSLLVWMLYAALSPIAIATARRFPLDSLRSVRRLPAHLGALVLMSFSHTLIYGTAVMPFVDGAPPFGDSFLEHAAINLRADIFVYALVVGAYQLYANAHYGRVRDAALARARLDVLKGQLQPHFLFNTLNSISTLVLKGDRDAAIRMLNRLADLLRASLAGATDHTVPLRDELALAQRYLDIETIRFGDRLRVELSIPTDVLDTRVPSLLLQPLVENAVRHGIAQDANAGLVEIHAQRDNGILRLEIRDDGPGPDATMVEGVGLSNSRERLRQLYGDRAHLTLGPGALRGAVVRIEIPV